jgi:hypothetical protein
VVPTSGSPNAVLADRSSLVGYCLLIAEDTATPGTLTRNGLTVEVLPPGAFWGEMGGQVSAYGPTA